MKASETARGARGRRERDGRTGGAAAGVQSARVLVNVVDGRRRAASHAVLFVNIQYFIYLIY